MPFPRYQPGQMPSAKVFNDLLAEVERLGKLRVSPPLQMYDGPFGLQIGLGAALGKGGIVAKAKVETGTYPTLKNYSLSFGTQQTIWQFATGSVSFTETTVGMPAFEEDGEYIWAFNPSKQYIPQSTLASLTSVEGQWVVTNHVPMSAIITSLPADYVGGTVSIDMGSFQCFAGASVGGFPYRSGSPCVCMPVYSGDIWQYQFTYIGCSGGGGE